MTAPARRLFIALWPDEPVRKALVEWQRACVPDRARKTHHDDFHMTLHFLGPVDPGRVAGLRAMCAGLDVPGFVLKIDHLGYFAGPRVLWGGPESTPEALLAMHGQLAVGLQALGFSLENRRYTPHVTLARKVRQAPQTVAASPVCWPVRQWALVESRPGRLPLYEPLTIWPMSEK